MGAATGKNGKVIKSSLLKESEMNDFKSLSNFPKEIIVSLHQNFSTFAMLNEENGLLEYPDFCLLINKRQSNLLAQAIFNAIDNGRDNAINFREFLRFISCFHKSSQDEKNNIIFNLFSGRNEQISPNQVYTMLHDAIYSNKVLSRYITDDSTIKNIVEHSFKNLMKTDIDFNVFYNMILSKYPNILKFMILDLDLLKNRKIKLKPKRKKSYELSF